MPGATSRRARHCFQWLKGSKPQHPIKHLTCELVEPVVTARPVCTAENLAKDGQRSAATVPRSRYDAFLMELFTWPVTPLPRQLEFRLI